MDKFVEEKQKDFAFIRLSRAKVAELAVLKFLESRGELDRFLTDLGVADSEAESIKRYLKAVG